MQAGGACKAMIKMMSGKQLQFWVMCLCIWLVACSGQSSGGARLLYLAVTDSPVDDVQQVVLQFTGVDLLTSDGAVQSVDFDPAKNIDLLALEGSISSNLLEGLALELTSISHMRLRVNASNSHVQIGPYSQPISIPAESEAALTFPVNLAPKVGSVTSMTVDFDLRRSLTTQDNNQTFLFNPVLRVINNATAGHVGGFVPDYYQATYDCLAKGDVYLFEGHNVTPVDISPGAGPLTTARVGNSNGGTRFELGFIPLGEYTLAFTCDASQDAIDVVNAISFPQVQNVTVSHVNVVTSNTFK